MIDKQLLRELGWQRGINVVVFAVNGCLIARSLEKEIDQHMKVAADVARLVDQGLPL